MYINQKGIICFSGWLSHGQSYHTLFLYILFWRDRVSVWQVRIREISLNIFSFYNDNFFSIRTFCAISYQMQTARSPNFPFSIYLITSSYILKLKVTGKLIGHNFDSNTWNLHRFK